MKFFDIMKFKLTFLFLILSLWTGLRGLLEIENRSHQVALANMRKTGLLVEAIEGAETLKSGQGGWRQLSLWQNISMIVVMIIILCLKMICCSIHRTQYANPASIPIIKIGSISASQLWR